MRQRCPHSISLAVLATLIASGAGADVLVLRDGSKVTTRGAWEIKGSMVVFTLENGTLGSLRLRDVDLDASAVATAEKLAPPPAPTEAPREKRAAVLTLTDADVARAPDDVLARQAAGATQATEAGSSESAKPAARGENIHVSVESFEEGYDPEVGGVQVTGILKNNGDQPASSINVVVEVYDDKGKMLASESARVGAVALGPGRTVGFVAKFPNIGVVQDVKFRVQHDTLLFEKDILPAEKAGEETPASES